jgi:hypothetical protein
VMVVPSPTPPAKSLLPETCKLFKPFKPFKPFKRFNPFDPRYGGPFPRSRLDGPGT